MIVDREFKAKVTVHFVKRDDGGLQAICDEVPGFCLSGKDPSAVYRDVIPALETLVRHNLDITVKVFPLRYGLYQMQESQKPSSIPEEQEYVVERVAA